MSYRALSLRVADPVSSWLPAVLMEKHRPSSDGVGAMSLRKSSIVAFCASLAACSSLGPLELSGDPAALPPFKTFRVHEEQFVFASELSPEEIARISAELRSAAVSAFERRGYRESSGNVDMLVSLAAISRPTLPEPGESGGNSALHPVDTSVLDPGQPGGPQFYDRPAGGAGREGDLLLYLLDPKTQRVLWQASANGAATTPAEALRHARSTYAAMVAKLPPANSDGAHE
jgi:hypothetical protein